MSHGQSSQGPASQGPSPAGAAWRALEEAGKRLAGVPLRVLFATDRDRFAAFSRGCGDLFADFSKEGISREGLELLFRLARAAGVEAQRDAMYAGGILNVTERRPALHMALRGGCDPVLDGERVAGAVAAEQARFLAFADDVRTGRVCGAGGLPVSDMVVIGTGGSAAGTAMAVRALSPWRGAVRIHHVSNIDSSALDDVVRQLDPRRTLFAVISKSFTTAETCANARAARAWLEASDMPPGPDQPFCAVTARPQAAAGAGIAPGRIFRFPDWAGGRFSLWGPVGLPLAVAIGPDAFRAFQAGGRLMDRHFLETPLEDNLPVLMGLVGIWRRNIAGCGSTAIIPYDHRLARLPACLQQLEMESNGKGVTREGDPLSRPACPVIWGEPGTDAQHSVFQLLHQGLDVIPVDFMVATCPATGDGRDESLLASCLAQSAALAFGRSSGMSAARPGGLDPAGAARLAPHLACPGNRPSTTLLWPRLTPGVLGQLLALYEHKVFVQGVCWGICSFDQWGVELGKEITAALLPVLRGGPAPEGMEPDPSTLGLIARARATGADRR